MSDTFSGWYIVEQLGHRRICGFVSEQTIAGKGFLRVDVPGADGEANQVTQFISPDTIYCLTPTTEDVARRAAATCHVAPIARYELPDLSPPVPTPPPRKTIRLDPLMGVTTCSECEHPKDRHLAYDEYNHPASRVEDVNHLACTVTDCDCEVAIDPVPF